MSQCALKMCARIFKRLRCCLRVFEFGFIETRIKNVRPEKEGESVTDTIYVFVYEHYYHFISNKQR